MSARDSLGLIQEIRKAVREEVLRELDRRTVRTLTEVDRRIATGRVTAPIGLGNDAAEDLAGTASAGQSNTAARSDHIHAGPLVEDTGVGVGNMATLNFIGATVTDQGSGVVDIEFSGGPGGSTFADDLFRVYDNGDANKKVAFECSGITTGNTRTLTVPDTSGTLALLTTANVFTANQRMPKIGVGRAPELLFDVEGDTGESYVRATAHRDDSGPTGLILAKSRGSTASPTTVQTGDAIGQLLFKAWEGTDYLNSSAIQSTVVGTISTGITPGNIRFLTMNTAGALALALTIGEAQKLWLGSSLDTNLYRGAANQVCSDDQIKSLASLFAVTGLHVGASGSFFVNLVGDAKRTVIDHPTATSYHTFDFARAGARRMGLTLPSNSDDFILYSASGAAASETETTRLRFYNATGEVRFLTAIDSASAVSFGAPGGAKLYNPTGLILQTDDKFYCTAISTNGGTNYWDLLGYTTTPPAATGYVTVAIDGVSYKLLAST